MFYLLSDTGAVTPMESYDFNKTEGLSVVLGCFDGVHLGHRALMERAVAKKGLTPAVWTFSEPLSLPFIDNACDSVSIFGKCGARLAICESFQLVKTLSPEQFVRHLVEDFNVKHFVSGQDFRYGVNRTGNTETLKADAEKYGATAETVPPVMTGEFPFLGLENEKVSSTLIRRLLSGGDVKTAAVLLGRPFSVTGCVVHGRQIGRTMNIPTVNQRIEKGRVVLKYGVYDTVTVIDGKRYPSVTNLGVRPTVNEDIGDVTCETHVIGEDLDLYGKDVTVEFYRYAREERKFSSLDELRETVEGDIKRAKEFFDKIST